MTCPSCRGDYLALVVCDDGKYRCVRCRDAKGPLERIERRLSLLAAGSAGPVAKAYAEAVRVVREEGL